MRPLVIRWISAKLRRDFSSEKNSSVGRAISKASVDPLNSKPPHAAEIQEIVQRAYALRKANGAPSLAYK